MTTVKIADASNQLSELVNRVASGRELIILTAEGKGLAVMLGVETFQDLVEMREYSDRSLMPLETFQQQFQQALVEAGYDSRAKIVNLVREVKREMEAEREFSASQSAENQGA